MTVLLKRLLENSYTWLPGSAGSEGKASQLSQAEKWVVSNLPPAPMSLKQDRMGQPHQVLSPRSQRAAKICLSSPPFLGPIFHSLKNKRNCFLNKALISPPRWTQCLKWSLLIRNYFCFYFLLLLLLFGGITVPISWLSCTLQSSFGLLILLLLFFLFLLNHLWRRWRSLVTVTLSLPLLLRWRHFTKG